MKQRFTGPLVGDCRECAAVIPERARWCPYCGAVGPMIDTVKHPSSSESVVQGVGRL